MVEIISIDPDNRINFRFDSSVTSCVLSVKASNFENPVFRQSYLGINPGTLFFITISHEIIPQLRGTYLEVESGDLSFSLNFEFLQTDLKGYSIISNSCLGWRVYERLNSPYNSPLIGSLILDDEKYIRLCEHTESYLSSDIKFGGVRNNEKYKEVTGRLRAINENFNVEEEYPISHHLDLDIHWIHSRERNINILEDGRYSFSETLDNAIIPLSEFYSRWQRRVERLRDTTKICIWTSSEMYNSHGNWRRKELLQRFMDLDKPSIFLTERRDEAYEDENHVIRFVPEWEGRHANERNLNGVMPWGGQWESSEIMEDIIIRKFL